MKVLEQEKLCGIPWTLVIYHEIVFQTFINFHESLEIQTILDNIWQFFQVILTIFTSKFWHFTEFNEKLWDFTKVYDIPRNFLSQITHFCSVSSNYKVLLAFRDFVLWQTKFFCLLLYHFTFRRHQRIFCHHQMKGDFFNIADT